MGELCHFDGKEDLESLWSEELDRVPLKQRLKLLLNREHVDGIETVRTDANVKREDEHFESQVNHSVCNTWDGMSDTVSSEESGPEECSRTEIGANYDVDLSKYTVKLEPENTENNSFQETCQIEVSIDNVQECAISSESHDVFVDDLDHVVLKERQRMLISSLPTLPFNCDTTNQSWREISQIYLAPQIS